jgi:hypothetical protein
VESLAAQSDVESVVDAVVVELVRTLRRSVPRLDRVTIVCRFAEHADAVDRSLAQARERVWARES